MILKKASLDAIRFACIKFHYAHRVPVNPVGYSVFENDVFCGVITFGYGANNNLSKSFGLRQGEVIELTRVALNGKQTKTSKAISCALKLIHKDCPLIRLVASYADITNQSHVGIIYQATNWLYLGKRTAKDAAYYIIKGRLVHGRSVRAKWGSEKNIPFKWKYADDQEKHLYAYPFDKTIQLKIEQYPKRVNSLVVEQRNSISQAVVQIQP